MGSRAGRRTRPGSRTASSSGSVWLVIQLQQARATVGVLRPVAVALARTARAGRSDGLTAREGARVVRVGRARTLRPVHVGETQVANRETQRVELPKHARQQRRNIRDEEPDHYA